MIGIMRLENDSAYNDTRPAIPNQQMLDHVENILRNRIKNIDANELNAALDRMQWVIAHWEDYKPDCWAPKYNRDKSYANDVPLMYSAGSHKNGHWGKAGIETPTSMRSVDSSCEAELSSRYEAKEV